MRRLRLCTFFLIVYLLCSGCLGSSGLKANDVCIQESDPLGGGNLYVVTNINESHCLAFIVNLDQNGAMGWDGASLMGAGACGTLEKIGELRDGRIIIFNREAYEKKVKNSNPFIQITNGTYPIFE